MGVYNPEKKMPTSCYMCWDSLYCEHKIKNPVEMVRGRADNCPLVEIDEGTERHSLNLWYYALLHYANDMGVSMEQAIEDLIIP